MRQFRLLPSAVVILAGGWYARQATAQDPLETETCRFLKQGTGKLVNAVEFQTSDTGKELDILLAIEFGIFDTLEIEVEPVVYTSIHPKAGANVSGFGDTEATLKYVFLSESDPYPGLAIAAEVKVPSSKNILIGTGEPDYTLTLIASKKLGDFDLHANLGFTIPGNPPGLLLNTTFNYAVAAVYSVGPTVDVLGEILGTTSSNKSGSAKNSASPDDSGGEDQLFLGAR